MTLETDMDTGLPKRDSSRYRPLGLLANPFTAAVGTPQPAIMCEIAKESHRLLAAIVEKSLEENAKPLLVKKADIPSSYTLTAVADVEASLAQDESIGILHAYVQLFMMKIGAVRATLGIVGERLTFRQFDVTLGLYLQKVIAEPDTTLPSYQLLGPERLAEFAQRLESDSVEAVRWAFGTAEIERRPDLAEVPDMRRLELADDVIDESETTEEIDATVGDAPGLAVLAAEESVAEDEDAQAVRDYLIEYTKQHLSPVLARGLRVYHQRGAAALAEELRITKAPRKTLAKLCEFAGVRFNKVVFIYDEFENWQDIDSGVRAKLVGAMSELRWATSHRALPVFMLRQGEAEEIEETFGGATLLDWDFSNLDAVHKNPDELRWELIDEWLRAAALPGADHTLPADDPAFLELRGLAGGSMARFLLLAHQAIESAAERGISALDAEAVRAAEERIAQQET